MIESIAIFLLPTFWAAWPHAAGNHPSHGVYRLVINNEEQATMSGFQKQVYSDLRTPAEIAATRPVELLVTLANAEEAYQLAQFCKRIGFDACLELTEANLSHDERTNRAHQMIKGLDAVANSLSQAGISPR